MGAPGLAFETWALLVKAHSVRPSFEAGRLAGIAPSQGSDGFAKMCELSELSELSRFEGRVPAVWRPGDCVREGKQVIAAFRGVGMGRAWSDHADIDAD